MDDAHTSGAPGRAGLRLALRLALELVVVFVGVYAAFALSAYEAKRAADEQRVQLRTALIREIDDILDNTRHVDTLLPAELTLFDSLVAAGVRPPLQPWLEPVRVEAHMWEASLQSGTIDLFDVATVYELSSFYNRLNAGFEQIAQLRSLSENVLIPNLDRPPDEFYDANARLRAKYGWYPAMQWRLARLAHEITAQGESVLRLLGQEPDAAGPVRDPVAGDTAAGR